jgi:transcriptional regulator with XRE-family HTH domain
MSRFGTHVRKLRTESGLSLAGLARKLGTRKGYVCSIELGRNNPPSVKLIRKYAEVFGVDERDLVMLAWVDKAPPVIRREAEEFQHWYQARSSTFKK